MSKPYSASCERNQEAIAGVLDYCLNGEDRSILEIGSGTGQHAVYMANRFPYITWTCTDLKSQHQGIDAWLKEAKLKNIRGPIEYEIGMSSFPEGNYDVIFTANTFHIIPWDKCKQLINLAAKKLERGSLFIVYGPFNYEGSYSSSSNAQFDIWLKTKSSKSAIRDFEEVKICMESNGFSLSEDFEMPTNNRTLVFVKK